MFVGSVFVFLCWCGYSFHSGKAELGVNVVFYYLCIVGQADLFVLECRWQLVEYLLIKLLLFVTVDRIHSV